MVHQTQLSVFGPNASARSRPRVDGTIECVGVKEQFSVNLVHSLWTDVTAVATRIVRGVRLTRRCVQGTCPVNASFGHVVNGQMWKLAVIPMMIGVALDFIRSLQRLEEDWESKHREV